MSVLCLNVCRLCVPNIVSLGVCFIKNFTRQSWRVCLIQRKIRVIFGVRFERQKVDKKASLHKN